MVPGDRWLLSKGGTMKVIPGGRWLLRKGVAMKVVPGDRWLLRKGGIYYTEYFQQIVRVSD